MHEARYYEKIDDVAFCSLCPRACRVSAAHSGVCGVRSFLPDASLFVSDSYGVISSQAVDPVEKKPLYHFHPGEAVFSVGTFGCNLSCRWCQNWQISQQKAPSCESVSPRTLIETCKSKNCAMIAYTYSEPIVWFEYVMDTASCAHENNIGNILVTNGNCASAPWMELLSLTDACNIDLKGFNADTLSAFTGASLVHVCDAIALAAEHTHLEITTLIVPGVNDTMAELRQIASFIASISPDIPWHITRYYPNYRYDRAPTGIELIENAWEMAREKLHYVYCGNYPVKPEGADTICPNCGSHVIVRKGYSVDLSALSGSCCSKCSEKIPVIR